MSAREDRERSREGPPQRMAETTPPEYPSRDYAFPTLQAVIEMQKTLGQLGQAIHTLTEQVKDNDKKLDKIALVVYSAGAVIAVLGTIGGFIVKGAWDLIEPILKAHI